uniref:Uncharacterized protein n=1 Tax=Triticum urartu TaxID=4572 RepID=A0A8R7RGM1_TRIUA
MEDCSCRCLAKMARITEGCVYESGLELTQTQRRGQLSCLLYINHGFRAPYICLSPDGWGLEGIMENVTQDQDCCSLFRDTDDGDFRQKGYQLREVAYHIDFDGCINLTTRWKEFVAESGFEDGDVVMVMFCREDDSLTFRM